MLLIPNAEITVLRGEDETKQAFVSASSIQMPDRLMDASCLAVVFGSRSLFVSKFQCAGSVTMADRGKFAHSAHVDSLG